MVQPLAPFAAYASRHARARVGVSIVTSLFLSLAAGAHQANNDTITLRMKFKPGDTRKYQMNMEMQFNFNLPGQDAPVSQKVESKVIQQLKVLSVSPEGLATLVATTVSSEMTANGETRPGPEIKPVTTIMDSRGQVVSMKGLPTAQAGMPDFSKMFGNGFNMSYLPEKAVRVGDTWTQPYSIPTLTTEGSKLTTAFVRRETVGTRHTALLHSTGVMPLRLQMNQQGQLTTKPEESAMQITGEMNMSSDTNNDIADGRVVRSTGTVDGAITMHVKQAPPGQPDTVKMNIKMKMSYKLVD